jgi:hypothetical protein
MNCANHADASAVAYCRTCGKALCANCTRPVRGVIYCEDCLGAKMEGVPAGTSAGSSGVASGFPATTFSSSSSSAASGQIPPTPPPVGSSGPNPTVAGILAGFFPFGVGAVYTGQYAKGLAHLVVITMLFAGANAGDHGNSEALKTICIFGLLFFWVYQIIDSVRSARAIQMAQPIPDPFGLAATFSGGAKIETNKIPMGAIMLILVGALFLLNTAGLDLELHRSWGLIPILIGVWLFATRWGLIGNQRACPCQQCRAQCLMGPAILVTVGVIGIIDGFRNVGFFGYAGGILLVVGGVKLLQGTSSAEGHIPSLATCANPVGGPIPPVPPVPPSPPIPPVPPTSEVNRG